MQTLLYETALFANFSPISVNLLQLLLGLFRLVLFSFLLFQVDLIHRSFSMSISRNRIPVS